MKLLIIEMIKEGLQLSCDQMEEFEFWDMANDVLNEEGNSHNLLIILSVDLPAQTLFVIDIFPSLLISILIAYLKTFSADVLQTWARGVC